MQCLCLGLGLIKFRAKLFNLKFDGFRGSKVDWNSFMKTESVSLYTWTWLSKVWWKWHFYQKCWNRKNFPAKKSWMIKCFWLGFLCCFVKKKVSLSFLPDMEPSFIWQKCFYLTNFLLCHLFWHYLQNYWNLK